ncbi:MAG: SPOR domain-containing protein [Flavobacteriaceae bacterium]
MRVFGSFFIFFLVGLPSLAQGQSDSVEIIQDSLIDKAFAIKIAANKEMYDQYYFRIQLFYGNYDKAQEIMKSVQRIAPDLEPQLSFETPNYKVQLGPFKKRSIAIARLQELKLHYREAFLLEPKFK